MNLPENTDLNTITTPGTYHIKGEIISTINNLPRCYHYINGPLNTNFGGCRLIVRAMHNTNFIKQELYSWTFINSIRTIDLNQGIINNWYTDVYASYTRSCNISYYFPNLFNDTGIFRVTRSGQIIMYSFFNFILKKDMLNGEVHQCSFLELINNDYLYYPLNRDVNANPGGQSNIILMLTNAAGQVLTCEFKLGSQGGNILEFRNNSGETLNSGIYFRGIYCIPVID